MLLKWEAHCIVNPLSDKQSCSEMIIATGSFVLAFNTLKVDFDFEE